MSRPDPIQYAERLYAAIRAANFSPISFLAFGSAVKDGVDLRRMPRIAAEPFMRVVGEMLELTTEMDDEIVETALASETAVDVPITPAAAIEASPSQRESTTEGAKASAPFADARPAEADE
jgi:hypothetical protein